MEEAALDGQFWTSVKHVLDLTKPIYHMIRFADTDKPVIGEVYEQMDTMLGQIKDIVHNRDLDLYKLIHDCVCVNGGIDSIFHYIAWRISLRQNTTLHLGWANLHQGVGLGPNAI